MPADVVDRATAGARSWRRGAGAVERPPRISIARASRHSSAAAETSCAARSATWCRNAIRYTPGGRPDLAALDRGRRRGRFAVDDTGLGIAPEHLPRLTERFYRVDSSRSRETGGTGLGLAIVKHIVLRHAGRLDITSEVGKGSTFSAVLPAERMIPVAGPTKPDPRLEKAA